MPPSTSSIQALIVDDEPLARANLRHALAAHPRWRVVGESGSAADAREQLAQMAAHVVFLDVQMPRESGLGLARSLSMLKEPPIVVFVTAFDTFAVGAFELHALDYLLKPFDDERLAQALRRAEEMLALRSRAAYGQALLGYLDDDPGRSPGQAPWLTRLSIRSIGRIESIQLRDVRWIAAAGNYVELHLRDRKVLHRVTISQLERRLDPASFIRVHRSTMVRCDECAALRTDGDGVYSLRLVGGGSVSVSSRYVKRVRAVIGVRR
ncbi:MAG: LytR/AlgR family response regulator transcription factor [Vicinamibacterales bacterium]